MQISVAITIAIVAVASASAEEPGTGLRPVPRVSETDEDTHLPRTRSSGGKTTAGAGDGGARGLRKRKDGRGKAGKTGKTGGGAKSGKGKGGGRDGPISGGERNNIFGAGSAGESGQGGDGGGLLGGVGGFSCSGVGVGRPCYLKDPYSTPCPDFNCIEGETCESQADQYSWHDTFGCCVMEAGGGGGGLLGAAGGSRLKNPDQYSNGGCKTCFLDDPHSVPGLSCTEYETCESRADQYSPFGCCV
mmetsp:Transcript_31120/g.70370  ORF Transcript_31120/g.70370 Transcript_31120/m.70370 type:complete len:246 (+) Transcript_31120:79-816(+)